MTNGDSRPLGELISGLVSDISGLFRKEIELAKTEASSKLSNALSGLEMFAIGLVLAIGAVGIMLAAIVNGLGAILVAMGFREANADAIASLVVALVVGLAAWVAISRGIAIVRNTSPTLPRTANSLRRDAEVVKEKMS
ncbi:phage holin family protein (plasmid) [Rhizobium sp. TH2]|uniref:phage holin family protein n=1 Tax=Rhizobium sp. TH2 TaxID=2775403 RepID=UPI00215751B0|nr:phage holin family protein [Rhizobium sp. TH2]UVC12379.1 phage holin family protein [Rhizobium sp. TH2]